MNGAGGVYDLIERRYFRFAMAVSYVHSFNVYL